MPADTVVPPVEVERVVSKLRTQKGIVIDYEVVDKATHFWAEHLPSVEKSVGDDAALEVVDVPTPAAPPFTVKPR